MSISDKDQKEIFYLKNEEKGTAKVDTQSRKYQLTINNPLDIELEEPVGSGTMVRCPFTHDEIKERIGRMKSVVYSCMADEMGLEEKTPHTHIYIVARSPIRFSTVKRLFPTAHIESAYGDSQTNRDYVAKQGKWAKSDKKETCVPGTFEEAGEMPVNEKIGMRGSLQFIYDMIMSGLSVVDILKTFPEAMRYLDKIERAKEMIIEDRYQNTWRDLTVTYIYGETEMGKTRSVMDTYGYGNVCRVTDYVHPFDSYDSTRHSVLLFEEFDSSLKIQDMLNYLDGYPCELRARYHNKVATYENVFITTNTPLEEQYVNIQSTSPATWRAFLRRIDRVMFFRSDGTVITYDSVDEYLNRDNGLQPLPEGDSTVPSEQRDLPFED